MTKYREILRLSGLGLSQQNIAEQLQCLQENGQSRFKAS